MCESRERRESRDSRESSAEVELALADFEGLDLRELQNVIERSVILSAGDVFSVDELWLSKASPRPATRVQSSVSTADGARGEREIIEAALAESRGRVAGPSGAAAKLGILASTLESNVPRPIVGLQQVERPLVDRAEPLALRGTGERPSHGRR